ncbi:MAG: hypothetical protein AB1427_20630 [Thermodesulfobacteriota bacterium]
MNLILYFFKLHMLLLLASELIWTLTITFRMFNKLLKNCACGRYTAFRGSRQGSHLLEYTALFESLRALPVSLILVFQQPVDANIAV